jgi:hypothetical protein
VDRTLIQAHKALDAACRFAEPNAEVLFVAALDGGLGSEEMEPFVADPDPDRMLQRLADRWVQYGHTTLRLVEKTSTFAISLDSDLPRETALRLGFEPVANPANVIESWRERFPGETVVVMKGPPVYPRCADRSN